MVRRRFRKVAKDKKTGVAKKYLSGAKNKSAKAAEIKLLTLPIAHAPIGTFLDPLDK